MWRTGLTKKKDYLQKLVIKGCPLGHDFNNSNCPLKDVKKLSADNLDDYFNNLSENQIDDILDYHKDCFSLFSFYL